MNTNYRGISLRPDIAALCRCSFNNRYRNTRYRRYGMPTRLQRTLRMHSSILFSWTCVISVCRLSRRRNPPPRGLRLLPTRRRESPRHYSEGLVCSPPAASLLARVRCLLSLARRPMSIIRKPCGKLSGTKHTRWGCSSASPIRCPGIRN